MRTPDAGVRVLILPNPSCETLETWGSGRRCCAMSRESVGTLVGTVGKYARFLGQADPKFPVPPLEGLREARGRSAIQFGGHQTGSGHGPLQLADCTDGADLLTESQSQSRRRG